MPACFLTVAFFILLTPVFGQHISSQLLTASGDSFSNEDYQIDWSLGELEINTYSAGGTMLSQGFQQGASSITTGTGKRTPAEISLYPNPVHDHLLLGIGDDMISAVHEGRVSATLSDINGRVLKIERVGENKQRIGLGDIEPGTYLFFIKKNNAVVRTFKIVKI